MGEAEDMRPCGWPDDAPEAFEEDESVLVFSRDAIRELDRLAVEEFRIPSILLMEHASLGVRHALTALLAEAEHPRVLIVCGRGNNGGDGLAVARHLYNDGIEVWVYLAPGDSMSEDAAANLEMARALGLTVLEAQEGEPGAALEGIIADEGPFDAIVDALLGTGVAGEVRGAGAELIRAMNRAAEADPEMLVVSVDVPSGLDAQTGEPLSPSPSGPTAVRAHATVTFVGFKEGFNSLAAQPYLGDVLVVPIGTPPALAARLGSPMPEGVHPGVEDAPE